MTLPEDLDGHNGKMLHGSMRTMSQDVFFVFCSRGVVVSMNSRKPMFDISHCLMITPHMGKIFILTCLIFLSAGLNRIAKFVQNYNCGVNKILKIVFRVLLLKKMSLKRDEGVQCTVN